MSRKLVSHFINTRKFFPLKKANKKKEAESSGFDDAAYNGRRSQEDDDDALVDTEEVVGAGLRFKNAEFDGLTLEKWYEMFVTVCTLYLIIS
jgi:hypothetical protein